VYIAALIVGTLDVDKQI